MSGPVGAAGRELAARLRQAVRRRPTETVGSSTGIPAAVLVPVVLHDHPAVLLTLRSLHLPTHAGQVSFPGGRIQPGDASPEAAALREAEEEIGLPRAAVEVVGRLPAYVTGTGFAVTPVLGLLAPPVAPRPDPREVAEVFELPLAALWTPPGPHEEEAVLRGRRRRYWVVPHERHRIWGATAAILVALAAWLRED